MKFGWELFPSKSVGRLRSAYIQLSTRTFLKEISHDLADRMWVKQKTCWEILQDLLPLSRGWKKYLFLVKVLVRCLTPFRNMRQQHIHHILQVWKIKSLWVIFTLDLSSLWARLHENYKRFFHFWCRTASGFILTHTQSLHIMKSS